MRRFLSVIVLLFMSLALFANDFIFTGKAPAKVGVGQQMQVQYTLNERPSSIQLGNISGFKLVGGPSEGSSTSMSIDNGVTTSSYSYTYTYTLEAVSEGSYTLGGAVAVVNGTKYTSNTISVIVQKDAVQQQRERSSNYYYDPFEDMEEFWGGQSSSQQLPQPQQKVEIADDDVLLRIHSTKSNLVKGEAALVTIKLYTAIDLTSIEDFTPPKFNDFYVEELDVNTTLEWTTETINGKKYNAAVLKKYLVFPRRAGKVEIDESNISCNARVFTEQSYWGNVYDSKSIAAKAPYVTLNVSELPSEHEEFSDIVGKFNISMNMPSDSVSVNEAVVCKITISGTGNFNNIESPKMLDAKEIESYDPVVNTNLKASESGLSGSKTWEYTLVPRYGGTYNLGSISLVYYDVATKRYNTVSTDSIIINVRNISE